LKKADMEVNIEDILVDPDLEEVLDPNAPPDLPKEPNPNIIDLSKDKKDYTEVEAKIDAIVNNPNTLDTATVAVDMVENRGVGVAQPPAPIINDPDDLLEGSIKANEIVQQMVLDPIKNDALCAAVKKDESTSHIFNQVLKEVAEEIAYLKAYRKVHYIAGEDISETSLKRVKTLKSLVETVLEKDKLNNQLGGKIDFHGDRFEKVMEYFLGTVKEAFEKSGIPEQFNDIFFVQLAQDLEGFEKKAEKIYYGKIK
jgi:hypothetical protein